MKKIFKIYGGGQWVRQAAENRKVIEISICENSDWVEKARCNGQDFFANTMWADDIETLKRWALDWGKGYGNVRFVEVEDSAV